MFSNKYWNVLSLNYRKLRTKYVCITCMRLKSSVEPKTKTYSHTILFPKTDFPARSNNARKDEIQKKAKFSELYNWQREHLKGPEFVLHDGPPYANGDLHMGHAVNKIIKDINNRSQVLQGNKVHYVPGWDCHGLPIELKALLKSKKDKVHVKSKENEESGSLLNNINLKHDNEMDKNAIELTNPIEIRAIARNFALETVERQKSAFESWGIMADWQKQCYLTLRTEYIQKQLRQFYRMFKKGLIYRALKPVYWSPSSKTALAEAELEYNPKHKSKEVYVAFSIKNVPEIVQDAVKSEPLSALIWTTTPWSLVANRAICYSPQMRYSVVTLQGKPGFYLVGSGLVQDLQKILGLEITKILEFEGHHLHKTTYHNHLLNTSLPFLEGDHVTEGKGTGLVHTAPAHGPEDFLVALRNRITVECNVDESGRYTNLDPELNGLPVLAEGQDLVIKRLGDSVLNQGTYVHSYPLDWRTKKPVLLRASHQWFIDTAALKKPALAALEDIQILPPSRAEQSRQGFRAQLEKRPYWCVSRQRAWGVPIPAVYCGNDVIVDESIVEKLCTLMETQGSDAWWTCDVTELLPDDVVKKYELEGKEVRKGMDIMDIWLDSGLSWQTLERVDGGRWRPAALYSEGVDQLTGWFQASLLTSVALNGVAPYRSIFVHGFVVDDKKRKMSKSIGNVIDPTTIIHGGKDKNKQPSYGVDTLRWWVASHATQHSQIVISKNLLDDCQAEIIRIRKILRYLLSGISDVPNTGFYEKPVLNYFDQYMVHESKEFVKQINEHYNNFRYNLVSQTILNFISNKVSGLYCHCVKDRLYCSEKSSNERLSAQLVIHTILVSLCKALGPILPHLVEEAWMYHPLNEKPFYFTDNLPVLDSNADPNLMGTVLDIKRDICVLAKNENLKKYSAEMKVERNLFEYVAHLNKKDGVTDSVLCEILELSSVKLTPMTDVKSDVRWEVKLTESENGQCLRCRKYNASENSDKCMRCESVLSSL